jgi:hypothetical protein
VIVGKSLSHIWFVVGEEIYLSDLFISHKILSCWVESGNWFNLWLCSDYLELGYQETGLVIIFSKKSVILGYIPDLLVVIIITKASLLFDRKSILFLRYN